MAYENGRTKNKKTRKPSQYYPPHPPKIVRSVGSLDLVSTPVHVVNLFEVVGSLPEVLERATRAVVDGVVVFLSELFQQAEQIPIISTDSRFS